MQWKDFTALHYATIQNRLKMVALLVEEGANINATSDNWTPLMMASTLGYVSIVKYLIAQHANIHHANALGNALFWATVSHHPDVIEVLLAAGCREMSHQLGYKTRELVSSSHQRQIDAIYSNYP